MFPAAWNIAFWPVISHAKNAGISEAILLDNSAADFEVTQSLQTYPTTGILLLIVNMQCMLAHPKF